MKGIISASVDVDLIEKLDAEAERKQITRSAAIDTALRAYLSAARSLDVKECPACGAVYSKRLPYCPACVELKKLAEAEAHVKLIDERDELHVRHKRTVERIEKMKQWLEEGHAEPEELRKLEAELLSIEKRLDVLDELLESKTDEGAGG